MALSDTRARCTELGVETAPVELRLFSTMVDSVLCHGAEESRVQQPAQETRQGAQRRSCRCVSSAGYWECGRRPPAPRCWRGRRRCRCGSVGCGAPPQVMQRCGARRPQQPGATSPRHQHSAGHLHTTVSPPQQPWTCQLVAAMVAPGLAIDLTNHRPSPRNRLPAAPPQALRAQGEPGGRHQIPAGRRRPSQRPPHHHPAA